MLPAALCGGQAGAGGCSLMEAGFVLAFDQPLYKVLADLVYHL